MPGQALCSDLGPDPNLELLLWSGELIGNLWVAAAIVLTSIECPTGLQSWQLPCQRIGQVDVCQHGCGVATRGLGRQYV